MNPAPVPVAPVTPTTPPSPGVAAPTISAPIATSQYDDPYNMVGKVKLGIRVAPLIGFSRINDQTSSDKINSDINYTANEVGVGISAGITADYFFAKNYAINFNLFYTSKQGSIKGSGIGYNNFRLSMIQLPVMLKLFTNELAPRYRVYFQVGASPDIVIDQKVKKSSIDASTNSNNNFPARTVGGDNLRGFDFSLWFGGGMEYRTSSETILTAGLSYNLGLLNMVKNNGAFNENSYFTDPVLSPASDRYKIRVDAISLDLGIKF